MWSIILNKLQYRQSDMECLPPKCLRRIFSYLPFEEVSQLRQVCTIFNEMGKKVLAQGQKEVKNRLMREMERAQEMVLLPNLHASYDRLNFLHDVYYVIETCALTYMRHLDWRNYYFVAGKVLDEANRLLDDLGGSSLLPHHPQPFYHHKPHPLLSALVRLAQMAYCHFRGVIVRGGFLSVDYDEEQESIRTNFVDEPECFWNEQRLERRTMNIGLRLRNRIKRRVLKREREISMREGINRGLLKLMNKISQNVLDLTAAAMRMRTIIDGEEDLEQQLAKGLSVLLITLNINSRKTDALVDKDKPNLINLPTFCQQKIIGYLSYENMSRLRMVCKFLNHACMKELKKGSELLKQQLQDEIAMLESSLPIYLTDEDNDRFFIHLNCYKDMMSLLMYCVNHYKWYMGNDYVFIAGKVLDEFFFLHASIAFLHSEIETLYDVFINLDERYYHRPHYVLFPLQTLVEKAVTHFKGIVVSRYFRSTQNLNYIPGFLMTDTLITCSYKRTVQLELMNLNEVLEEQEVELKRQREANRKRVLTIRQLLKEDCVALMNGVKKVKP